jgi:hypothetical protein
MVGMGVGEKERVNVIGGNTRKPQALLPGAQSGAHGAAGARIHGDDPVSGADQVGVDGDLQAGLVMRFVRQRGRFLRGRVFETNDHVGRHGTIAVGQSDDVDIANAMTGDGTGWRAGSRCLGCGAVVAKQGRHGQRRWCQGESA